MKPDEKPIEAQRFEKPFAGEEKGFSSSNSHWELR